MITATEWKADCLSQLFDDDKIVARMLLGLSCGTTEAGLLQRAMNELDEVMSEVSVAHSTGFLPMSEKDFELRSGRGELMPGHYPISDYPGKGVAVGVITKHKDIFDCCSPNPLDRDGGLYDSLTYWGPEVADQWVAYATSNKFLESYEWKRARVKTIERWGNRCLCCGAAPPSIVINVDHIKSRQRWPELALNLNNLQPLCGPCNYGKSNDEIDFRRP